MNGLSVAMKRVTVTERARDRSLITDVSSCDHEATMHTCQTGVWMCVVLCCVVSRLQRLVNVLRHKLLTLAVQHDFEP